MSSLNVLKVDLLFAGIAVLCFTFSALAMYLFFIDKHLNLIWELLRIRVCNSFFELRENIEARLILIHEKDDIIEHEVHQTVLKNTESLKFRHSLRTIARFSIIFILAAFFIILQCFLLEQNLQDSLWYHPTLTSAIMNRKILTTRITYYVIESRTEGYICSLDNLFPYYNSISDPQENVMINYNRLSILINEMRELSVKSIFSPELQQFIYKSYPSNYTFLITGTLNAMAYFIEESLNYAFNNATSTDENIYIYFDESLALYSSINITAAMGISDLRNLIDAQLNILYYFTGGFGGFFLMIYLCYYYPMLAFEIKFLKKLTDIIQIIPKNLNSSIFKSVSQTKARFSVVSSI